MASAVIEAAPDEALDDMDLIAAVMPELAVALKANADLSARLVARLEEAVADGDRQLAKLGLTAR